VLCPVNVRAIARLEASAGTPKVAITELSESR
jgi:hypothetical protein